ncbi:MAG TPA: ABC transporter permease [Nitrososphaerales archaeon]|nr:ABC transporter permease [Nitrososphaerales archaeon]
MTLFFDTEYLFVRALKKVIRNPILLFFSLFQPVLFLTLFTQLFKGLGGLAGFPSGSYIAFVTPGILLQNGFTSALQSGTSMVDELNSGFLQNMLVTQVNRSAILLGRLLSDAFRVCVQSIIILVMAYLLGAQMVTGIAGVVVILVTIASFGLAWSGISLSIGLATRRAETVTAIGFFLTFPLLFMSTALFPQAFLPSWMQIVSSLNPVSYNVNAIRDLALGGITWSTMLSAYGVTALLAVLTLGATLYQFRKVVS